MNDFKNKLKNVEGVDSSILEAIKWGAPPPPPGRSASPGRAELWIPVFSAELPLNNLAKK